jgi:hypothetical protein
MDTNTAFRIVLTGAVGEDRATAMLTKHGLPILLKSLEDYCGVRRARPTREVVDDWVRSVAS